MTREQLISAMSDAFQSAPPDGAARWGAVASVVERFALERHVANSGDLISLLRGALPYVNGYGTAGGDTVLYEAQDATETRIRDFLAKAGRL